MCTTYVPQSSNRAWAYLFALGVAQNVSEGGGFLFEQLPVNIYTSNGIALHQQIATDHRDPVAVAWWHSCSANASAAGSSVGRIPALRHIHSCIHSFINEFIHSFMHIFHFFVANFRRGKKARESDQPKPTMHAGELQEGVLSPMCGKGPRHEPGENGMDPRDHTGRSISYESCHGGLEMQLKR